MCIQDQPEVPAANRALGSGRRAATHDAAATSSLQAADSLGREAKLLRLAAALADGSFHIDGHAIAAKLVAG